MTKRNKAAYLGTFDPLTNGHLDVITRASKIFDELLIGVGHNSRKMIAFSLEDRLQMMSQSCSKLKNVKVMSFQGLAIDFALAHDVSVIVRGIRTEADYVYEMQMAMMNYTLSQEIETIFIPTRQGLSHISSTLVNEVAQLGGDVSQLVPPTVQKKLDERYK